VENIRYIIGIVLAISILFQFITALLAFRLIRITGMHIAWISIAMALFFMAIRRCISLLQLISGDVAYSTSLEAELVAMVTSVLMLVGVAWIAPLFLSITSSKEDLQKSVERIKHLNSILNTIRKVNQLIVEENQRESLIQKTCDILISKRDYVAAWIGILEDGETFATIKSSGLLEDVSRLGKDVTYGDLPSCIKNALTWKEMALVVERTRECEDCPFKSKHTGKKAVIIRIEHAGRLFGLLFILPPVDVVLDKEEVTLLKEVASDIGLGLNKMEMEKALQERDARFRNLLETVPNVSVVGYGADGTVHDWNKASETIYGYTAQEAIGKNLIDLIIPPEMRDEVHEIIKHGALTGEMPQASEISHISKDRTLLCVLSSHVVVQQPGRKPELFCIDIDLTELKRAEDKIKASLKEKDVLMREIHHRVKNNLQVLSSLFNMQVRTLKDKDMIDAFSESRNRINAMALVHSQLYESGDLSQINMKGFIDKLLMQLLQTYQVQDTKITRIVSVVDRPFPISTATPVGLIINELLSNALKHSFVDRKEGKIEIILSASEENKINMIVNDDGIGLPEGFDIDKTRTLGLRLVKILVEDQLQGNLEVISNKGATFNVEFEMEGNGRVYS
jgi:PAS domain S-box-containing protein